MTRLAVLSPKKEQIVMIPSARLPKKANTTADDKIGTTVMASFPLDIAIDSAVPSKGIPLSTQKGLIIEKLWLLLRTFLARIYRAAKKSSGRSMEFEQMQRDVQLEISS